MYYNIHTHQIASQNTTATTIYNLNIADYVCCCGLDLRNLNYSLGIHPWKIREDQLSKEIDFIEKNAFFNCVKMIGECGLDKLCDTPWELQLRAFVAQIKISERIGKPLIIHCVKAFEDLIALKKELKPKQAWIIHGFRGKPELMQQLVGQGFFLSFGSRYNEESMRIIPPDRFFPETDDESEPIQAIYQKIAASRGMSLEELVRQITDNVQDLQLLSKD